jgi:hypothetical protein
MVLQNTPIIYRHPVLTMPGQQNIKSVRLCKIKSVPHYLDSVLELLNEYFNT